MKLVNECLNCEYEWVQNFPVLCPNCGSEAYYTITNYNYENITIEDAIEMQEKGFSMICDADTHEVDFDLEE